MYTWHRYAVIILQVLYFSVILISLLIIHINSRHEPIDFITYDIEKLNMHEEFLYYYNDSLF